MPKRKRVSAMRRRRSTRRRYRTGRFRRRANIARSLRAPIPDKAIVKLRYSQFVQLTPPIAGGQPGYHLFRANGVYDPDVSVGGHQPIGFDQWMTFFTHWYVVSSTITVTFANNTAESPSVGTLLCGIHLDAGSSSPATTTQHLRELPKTLWKTLTPENGKVQVKYRYRHRRFFRQSVFDDQFQGNDSSDPAEQAYFHIFAAAHNEGQGNPAAVNAQVLISYTVALRERRALGQS